MASLTQLTWVCRDSRGWWCTGRPGVLQFMGSQRVIHYSGTELNWTDGNRCYDLSFLSIEFKPTSSFSSFTFIKWLFNSSLLSTIRVVSSVYLMLLIFLLAILIPASSSWNASCNPVFHMMYSAYKLNKPGDNIQPWHIPFPIWNQSVVTYPVLTVASWQAYRFLRRQVRWSGIPISLRVFHSLLWSTVKGFGIDNKADVFLELSWFSSDPLDAGNLISGSSAFSKSS